MKVKSQINTTSGKALLMLISLLFGVSNWTVYGKVSSVIREPNSIKPDLEFIYDASGNRITKIVKPKNSSGVILGIKEWTYTDYVRDASGNVMATYERKYDKNTLLPNEGIWESLIQLSGTEGVTVNFNISINGNWLIDLNDVWTGQSSLPQIISAINNSNSNPNLTASSVPGCVGCIKLSSITTHGDIALGTSDNEHFALTLIKPFAFKTNNNNYLTERKLSDHHIYGSKRLGIEERNLVLPITGSTIMQDDFEININGWTPVNSSSTLSKENGVLRMESSTQYAQSQKMFATETGQRYKVKVGFVKGTSVAAGFTMYNGYDAISDPIWMGADGQYEVEFEAQGVSTALIFYSQDNTNTTVTNFLDYVQVELNSVGIVNRERGDKRYEHSNHLGDVMSTVTDRKIYNTGTQDYSAEVMSASTYYPFGMTMWSAGVPSKFGVNGMERIDELNPDDYDFGARIYNGKIGRWMSCDAMTSRSPGITSYRFGKNNPILFFDPDGNYETDGHYWTIYLMGITMGLDPSTAEKLANSAESWDTKIHGNYAVQNFTWANPVYQQTIHGLTGNDAIRQRLDAFNQFIAADNIDDLGQALHLLGDSYAHTDMNNSGKMYGNGGVYTTEHAFTDEGLRPDIIGARRDLYIDYTRDLAAALGLKYDLILPQDGLDVFQEISSFVSGRYDPLHPATGSMIGIINYHVAKKMGRSEFVIQYAQGPISTWEDHQQHFENTKAYLDYKGIKYKSELYFQTIEVADGYGGTYDQVSYAGIKFTIQSATQTTSHNPIFYSSSKGAVLQNGAIIMNQSRNENNHIEVSNVEDPGF